MAPLTKIYHASSGRQPMGDINTIGEVGRYMFPKGPGRTVHSGIQAHERHPYVEVGAAYHVG